VISHSEYLQGTVLKLEGKLHDEVGDRMSTLQACRINHAAMGLVTESAEIMDAVKKYAQYGKPFDRANLIEELGDVMWYAHLLADELHTTIQHAMQVNADKLKKRYGDKFTEEAALNRDLKSERGVLEEGAARG